MADTTEVALPVSAIPEELKGAHHRLFDVLKRPDPTQRQHAWAVLVNWKLEYEALGGDRFAPPWVFSNEEGEVEFEFHKNGRNLGLVVYSHDVEYSAYRDLEFGTFWSREGRCADEAVPRLLMWMFGHWKWEDPKRMD